MSASRVFVLDGNSSILANDFIEPIFLDNNSEYVMGLTSFESFNSIPNIDETNNNFSYGIDTVIMPTGSYEINDIENLLRTIVQETGDVLSLKANNNTLQTSIKCNKAIDFTQENSIGPLLGFDRKILAANITHISDHPVNILKINTLCIECNITKGSFKNGEPCHIIHHFFPNVPPGFKIIEAPENVIYLPINVNTITNITVKILDQSGNLVNFRGETITVGLHLKKI